MKTHHTPHGKAVVVAAIGVAGDSKREEYRVRLAAIADLAEKLGEENEPVLTAGIRLGDCARFCGELDDIGYILEDYKKQSWQLGKTRIAERVNEIQQSMQTLHMQLGEQLKIAAQEIEAKDDRQTDD